MATYFTPGLFSLKTGRRLLALALVGLVLALPACDDEKTNSLIDQRGAEAKQSLLDMNNPTPVHRYNPLVVTDKVYGGKEALRLHRGIPLPPRYETQHGIALVSSEPMSLPEIANAITVQTGIPVHLSDLGGTPSGGGASSAPPKGITGGSAMPASSSTSGNGMPVSYEGALSGLLERVAGNFGVNWHYDGSTISIARFETRTFVIEALPGTESVQEGMQDDSSSSSGSSGGSSSGGATPAAQTSSITQNSKFSIDFKYWDELSQILTTMLGGTGTVVASPSVGTVTISTTPEIMRTVADYLSKENDRLSRQIAINVEIYSVSLTEGMDFNIAFNTVLRRLTNFGGNFTGASAPSTVSGFTGGGTLSLAILNPYNAGQIGNSNSGVGQVTDLFTLLNGIGDTTRVARFPLVTLNNRPVSRRVGQDVAYVASSTTSNTAIGSTSNVGTSVTPGTIHQGFSVQLTPRLLDDGRILLQYSLSVIDLLSLPEFNSTCGAVSGSSGSSSCQSSSSAAGSTTVQLPTTQQRIFVQQSVLKSGSMLLLGGSEEEDLSHNSQGVGDPSFYLLGGGTSSNKTHTMLFMAVTPQVLDEPHSERD